MYLSLEKNKYCVVWHKLFQSSQSGLWNLDLLLVELLLSLPVSNANVKQMFSLTKQIKTDGRSSLLEKNFEYPDSNLHGRARTRFFSSYSRNDPLE